MKQCTKCQIFYPIDQFHKDSQKSCGHRPSCRNCDNKRHNNDYNKDKEKYAKASKIYREENAEKLSQKRKNNREKHNKWLRDWQLKNPEKHRANVQRQVEKVKNTPQLKIKKNLRTRIGFLLKGKNKSASMLALLGCSMDEFKKHFESKFSEGMNWENYGFWKVGEPMKWHIDHITPCDSFDLTDPEQQKICFHYTNLQPLWAIDNLKKQNKMLIDNNQE